MRSGVEVLVVCVASISSAALLGTTPAAAQSPPRAGAAARADALFDQGKSEMNAGRYAAACAAFGESYALDAADGTLLALALCHEQQGELVKAFGELQAVHASSLRSGREDRQRVARAALSRVEPRIARVAIRVPSRDRACASSLRIDDAQVHVTEEASPDRGLVVGRHRISCERQPGDSWSTMVDVGAGELAVVVVPEKSEPGASAASVSPAPVGPVRPPAEQESSGVSPLAWVVGGAGVLSLGVGTVFGLRAASQWGDVEAKCDPSACADRSAGEDANGAQRSATVSNVTLVAGVVLVAIGVVIGVTSSSRSSAARPVRASLPMGAYRGLP